MQCRAQTSGQPARQRAWRTLAVSWLLAVGCLSGCAETSWVRVREAPYNPLAGPLQLLSPSGPQPTARTQLLLRRYDLESDFKHHPVEVLGKLHEISQREPSAEKLYSLSELAYLVGKRSEAMNRRRALDLYGLAMVEAYHYLFDQRFGRYRNPYDPEFRGACELYNGALEATLRQVKKQGRFAAGSTYTVRSANQTIEATIVLSGDGWRADDFEGFRFVSDYEIRGLQNQYHSYGLGVPLIAVRKHHANPSGEEKYYPPGVTFPVTAFLRVLPSRDQDPTHHVVHIELHDTLNNSYVNVDGRPVPLESDLTTPLAYALNQKRLRNLDSSTAGLLDPAQTEKLQGLYMLEPYQPGKIPVLMIHGIWSSPITWMEMFNDLRRAPEIRSRYQFWFYLYPSGEPFWDSAAKLRADLVEARRIIDPRRQQPALDQMVLVGHSMGGLVAELQTLDSRDDFWKVISDQPLEALKASDAARKYLVDTYFFRPNPAVRRVITIGTPFHGSQMANSTTRWLGNKLIKLPEMTLDDARQLHKDNPDMFHEPCNLIDIRTSIDALAPDSPILPVMAEAQRAAWVRYHNIIGRVPDRSLIGRVVGGSDGLVSCESAHQEKAVSEIVVNADHLELTRHPLSVLEVHRVLLDHLVEVDAPPPGRLERLPFTASARDRAGAERRSPPPVATIPPAMPPQTAPPVVGPTANGAPNPAANQPPAAPKSSLLP